MKMIKNISTSICHHILVSSLVAYLIEILVIGVVVVRSYPIGIAGGYVRYLKISLTFFLGSMYFLDSILFISDKPGFSNSFGA